MRSPGSIAAAQDPVDATLPADKRTPLRLGVNGKTHEVLVEPRWSLLFVLREKLGLTAAKPGCERGECGACSVLIDDILRYACLTLAVEAEGRRIETAEGLMQGERLGAVPQSFVEHPQVRGAAGACRSPGCTWRRPTARHARQCSSRAR